MSRHHIQHGIGRHALPSVFMIFTAALMGLLLWAEIPSLFAGDRHLLWSVPSDRGRVTLMGSIHTLRQDACPLPAPLEQAFILQSLQELDILESMALRLTEAWRTGDAAGLDDIIRMGFRGFPELHDRLITQRNQQWLPAIEELIRQGKQALVIVGAGHLVGPQGLVALLKERGYVLEQH